MEVQKRTFTNWFNDRLRGNLKVSKYKVDDLYEDLKDGILLVAICEQLAKPRKIQKYNKKVVNKLQAIENLGIVLRFCASENIKLVNIGEYAICYLGMHHVRLLHIAIYNRRPCRIYIATYIDWNSCHVAYNPIDFDSFPKPNYVQG